jgi:hypothetical protein
MSGMAELSNNQTGKSEAPQGDGVPEKAETSWFQSAYYYGASIAGRVQEGFRGLFSNAYDRSLDMADMLSATSSQLLEGSAWLYKGSGLIGNSSAAFAAESFEKLLNGAIDLTRAVGNGAEYGLDQLAGDPNKEHSLSIKGLRMAAGLLPIIGNTQGYAQARLKYRSAEKIEDLDLREKTLHEARRDCLIVSTALSLEIATLGVSGKLDLLFKAGSTMFSMLNFTKVAREETAKSSWLPQINIDLLTVQADRALGFGPIRDAMDILLRADTKSLLGGSSDNQ